MPDNLFNKIWDLHKVKDLPNGQTQIFVGLHLIHEVTSPQGFQMLRERNLKVLYPKRTFATVDHVVPTTSHKRPFADPLAEKMTCEIEKNSQEFGFKLFSLPAGKQGIVHVVMPERGLVQPGMVIACGDSHTSTHGAFGAIALGIGTSQVRDVLATQCLSLNKLKVRKIDIKGNLGKGVYAKDVILDIIRRLGVKGGLGYAYEYAGNVIEEMNMEARMTVCNMTIEGGARCGYVNPDEKTFDYLKGREYAPKDENFDNAVKFWKSVASDPNADFDDHVEIDASKLEPAVTWGINPGQAIGISEAIPSLDSFSKEEKKIAGQALKYMEFSEGEQIKGKKIDVVFIGSCTNGRLSDLKEAAKIIEGKKISSNVRALAVPGTMQIKKAAEEIGLDKIFTDAGFEWRKAGCSMCLAMNPDKLIGNELCASTSNRNFIGRQGSPTGRTILMSPAMAAIAAIEGKIVDVREYL